MIIPNWQHHSSKEQKPTLKPQAMRDRREALKAFKIPIGRDFAFTCLCDREEHRLREV